MDGNNDRVIANVADQFNVGNGDFTIMARWVYLSSVSQRDGNTRAMRVLSKDTGSNGYQLSVSGESVFFNTRAAGDTYRSLTINHSYQYGDDALVAVSRYGVEKGLDNSNGAAYTPFINGQKTIFASNATVQMASANLDSTANFMLGWTGSASHYSMPGYILAVAMWRRGLTDEEHAGLQEGIYPADGIISAWRFDQKSGGSVADITGSGIDFILSNYEASTMEAGLNSAWVPRGGILTFNTARTKNTFYAESEASVQHLFKFLGLATTFNWWHYSKEDFLLASGTGDFGASTSLAFPLEMAEGDYLEIEYFVDKNGVAIEVHYT